MRPVQSFSACTRVHFNLPQCLYKGALYLILYLTLMRTVCSAPKLLGLVAPMPKFYNPESKLWYVYRMGCSWTPHEYDISSQWKGKVHWSCNTNDDSSGIAQLEFRLRKSSLLKLLVRMPTIFHANQSEYFYRFSRIIRKGRVRKKYFILAKQAIRVPSRSIQTHRVQFGLLISPHNINADVWTWRSLAIQSKP